MRWGAHGQVTPTVAPILVKELRQGTGQWGPEQGDSAVQGKRGKSRTGTG